VFDLDAGLDVLLERWLHSPAVREHERGAIDHEQFAQCIVHEAKLPYDCDEFLDRFRRWPLGLFPETRSILTSIPPSYDKALMSNTNALHWHECGECASLAPYFDQIFLSFETGRLKPDEDAFLHVAGELSVKPGQIAFFDDNPQNVAAAKRAGMQAFLTRGPRQLELALRTAGVPLTDRLSR
jgi:putative hydrolase of the HAD superfamily